MNVRAGLVATLFLALTAATVQAKTYTVRSGDTLIEIANRHDITVAELKSANDLLAGREGNALSIGQTLIIPEFEDDDLPAVINSYRVVRGDWLSKIARRFNTSVKWLKETNGLSSDDIAVGQILKVPGAGGEPNATPPQFVGAKQQPAMTVSRAELTVLARIVKGECDARISREGIVAVAAVVLNRVRSKSYPSTITRVAHQHRQFSSYDRVRRQTLYYGAIPQYAWDAARAALEGEDPTHGATVYFNPELVRWNHEIRKAAAKMQFVKRIGTRSYDSHVFYRVRPNRVLEARRNEAATTNGRGLVGLGAR